MHEYGNSGVLEWLGCQAKAPLGAAQPLMCHRGGRGGGGACLDPCSQKGVAPRKFMTKAGTRNWSAGTGPMLAKASNLETSPLTHTV